MISLVETLTQPLLETMAAIHVASFPLSQQWSAEELANVFSMPGVFCFVKEIRSGDTENWENSRRVVGFLIGRIVMDEAEILTFAVAPTEQRQGYGKEILLSVIDYLKKAEIKFFFLEVSQSNIAAILLYKNQGFLKTGSRKNYYPDNSHADVMTRIM